MRCGNLRRRPCGLRLYRGRGRVLLDTAGCLRTRRTRMHAAPPLPQQGSLHSQEPPEHPREARRVCRAQHDMHACDGISGG